MNKEFSVLKKGVRFECQGSGKCCLSRGEYGYVYLTKEDRRNMAQVLKLTTSAFTRKYCEKSVDGMFYLKSDSEAEECTFLKNKKCEVYQARPMQCRTWPFWPEVMNAKAWNAEVKSFCPGVGKGRLYEPAEIAAILEKQSRSEEEY